MKQSTVKTLGVAALGAVFAAVGTGAATAAPDPTAALGPAQNPLTTLSPAMQAAQKVVGGTGPVRQTRQLLGGVPTDHLNTVLPLGR